MSTEKKDVIIVSPPNKKDNDKNPLSNSLKIGIQKVLEIELSDNHANPSDNNRKILKALKRLNSSSSSNATNKPNTNAKRMKTSNQKNETVKKTAKTSTQKSQPPKSNRSSQQRESKNKPKQTSETSSEKVNNQNGEQSRFASPNKFETLSTMVNDQNDGKIIETPGPNRQQQIKGKNLQNHFNDEKKDDVSVTDENMEFESEDEDDMDREKQNKHRERGKPVNAKNPPMYLFGINTKNAIEIVSSITGNKNFSLKSLGNNKLELKLENKNDFHTVFNVLKEKKIEVFTRAPKEEKILSFLLKGIDGDFSEGEITSELKELGIDQVEIIKVKKINTKEFFKAKRGGDAFLVQTTGKSKIGNLLKINKLAYQKIKWERIRRKNSVQCWNCQRLGHVAKFCGRPFRCVKCPNDHKPGECTFVNQSDDVFCINCNKPGHPASFRGCPTLVEMSKKINDKKIEINQKKETKMQHLTNKIKTGVSFANATKKDLLNINVNNNENEMNVESNEIEEKLGSVLDKFKNEILNFFSFELIKINEKLDKNIEMTKVTCEKLNIEYV